jgi:DNA repair protein RecN (Recombination protein N)
MLRNLHIQNYALIDELDIEFRNGLNIITGETGAGKSILLGALALILGQRADASVLKDKSKNCIVEGLFEVSGYNLEPFFRENDLDYYPNTIIRRQINESGKSRAFVNEVPVNLNVLKELGDSLIDVHSQHQNLLLSSNAFQTSAIDAFAKTQTDLEAYRVTYSRYRKLQEELAELENKAKASLANLDYLQHQFKQLDEAKLKVDEQPDLEQLQQQLSNAEDIKTGLQLATEMLDSNEQSVIPVLKNAQSSIQRIAHFLPEAKNLTNRIESCRTELRDIQEEMAKLNDKVQLDPEQLSIVNARLDLLFTLQQKHRVASANDLIAIRDSLKLEVDQITGYDTYIESKKAELNSSLKTLTTQAATISKKRRDSISKFENNIVSTLKLLGMPFVDFIVKIDETSDFNAQGKDSINFMFTANKQVAPQELSKIASGGEISRLMLSLKSLMISNTGLPTIIFDEIDTGVSGEVADKVGNIINTMGKGMQVINITHLPQIACKGHTHFMVYKDNLTETSKTRIKLLDSEERIIEIAKMLSGESLSEAAITNAKHLLSQNN